MPARNCLGVPERLVQTACSLLFCVLISSLTTATDAADGVHFRIMLMEPADQPWFVRIGGYIHNDPWYLKNAVLPADADTDVAKRVAPGQFSPWFDLLTHSGGKLHPRQERAGGLAELPNITLKFDSSAAKVKHRVVIELATAADPATVVKLLEETFEGDSTSFLASPNLKQDADSLETAGEMTDRRLAWAREASGGKRIAPEKLWVQTQFWSPQRAELNEREAEVLWLLGFNVVGNTTPEMLTKFPFTQPSGHHCVEFGPGLSRLNCDQQIDLALKSAKGADRPTPFGFSDEVACRPPIGTDESALKNFRQWLKQRNIAPDELGVASLDEVQPIESPAALAKRQSENKEAANRTFTWTTRFRHESANERIKWLTESFHRGAPPNVLTSTLVADHPYFGGSGLGMGMATENSTWGGFPLSLDWFGMARDRVVDVIGIEDWLGLEYMYGPAFTWEGFQLIGFQAAMMRSGSRGLIPIISWITPSDEKNLRLKSASALCQGAKHFFYWTYGPTATSTENYWSDLRGAYDGVVHMTRQLAGAEHIIEPGQPRKTRVALLYSLSSDLWQPFGYLHMAERRLTYLSLIHDQYLVDMLTEHDVESGRLAEYDVLYVTDPCVSAATCNAVRAWVTEGGLLFGSGAPATFNEFGLPHDGLADVFGLKPGPDIKVQEGRFDVRGGLNEMPWFDEVQPLDGPAFGAMGLRVAFEATDAKNIGAFKDGTPAIFEHHYGNGHARLIATCPGVSYAKDARFSPKALAEKWPLTQREFINRQAKLSGAPPLAKLSHPVVEVGIFDSPQGTALILANFSYDPITMLEIEVPLRQAPTKVTSIETQELTFTTVKASESQIAAGYSVVVKFAVSLGWNDIVTFE